VNKKAITTISILEETKRIIFNLNYSITSYDKRTSKSIEISKFIFWNYSNDDVMQDDMLEINEAIAHQIEI